MGKSNNIVYAVRSEYNEDDIHVFNSRPVLARGMTKITGKEWVLETLHYHFTKKKEYNFSKNGWGIYVCNVYGVLQNDVPIYVLVEKDNLISIHANKIVLTEYLVNYHKILDLSNIFDILESDKKIEMKDFIIYSRVLNV